MRRLAKVFFGLLMPFFTAGALAEENKFFEFLQGLDSVANAICDTAVPTTNDLVTGEKTLNAYNREEQIRQSNAYAEQHINELEARGIRRNDFNPALRERVSRIIDEILAVSHLRHEQWYFDFIDDPEFNAYVHGGNIIFVNRGAVEGFSDDEIAAIVGHEIAHVALNHVYEKISHKKIVEKTKSQSINREWFKAAFRHEQEEEADKYGILYAALAGYDPVAAAHLWQREHQKTGHYYFMRGHPMNAERAQATWQAAQQWRQYYMPGVQNPNFAAILDAQKSTNISDKVDVGKGGGLLGCAETYAGIQQKHNAAKAEEQRQKNQASASAIAEQRRVAVISAVAKLISIDKIVMVSPNEIAVNLRYLGDRPISVEMAAEIKTNGATSNPSSGILHPGFLFDSSYNIIFRFNESVFAPVQHLLPLEVPPGVVKSDININIRNVAKP